MLKKFKIYSMILEDMSSSNDAPPNEKFVSQWL